LRGLFGFLPLGSCGFGAVLSIRLRVFLKPSSWALYMTENPSDDWPDPSYHIGQRDHLHALGVITASYNQLEFTLFVLFLRYLKMEPEPAQKVFVLMSNPNRIDLLRDAVTAEEKDPIVQDRVLYFIEAFETLASSRNFLAHSHTILGTPDQDHLTFGKGSKRQPRNWSFAHMTLTDLRKIADDIRTYWSFGMGLDRWIVGRSSGAHAHLLKTGRRSIPPLPEKPPQPAKLTSVPHGVLESPPPRLDISGVILF
jgi:hypothetical protein